MRAIVELWQGELPLGRAFWLWGVLGGTSVSLASTLAAAMLLAADAPAGLAALALSHPGEFKASQWPWPRAWATSPGHPARPSPTNPIPGAWRLGLGRAQCRPGAGPRSAGSGSPSPGSTGDRNPVPPVVLSPAGSRGPCACRCPKAAPASLAGSPLSPTLRLHSPFENCAGCCIGLPQRRGRSRPGRWIRRAHAVGAPGTIMDGTCGHRRACRGRGRMAARGRAGARAGGAARRPDHGHALARRPARPRGGARGGACLAGEYQLLGRRHF